MSQHLWIPVSAGDCSAGPAVLARIAPGLTRREAIRLTELDSLFRHLPDRPTDRDLREAADRTRFTPGELREYHARRRREAAERRSLRQAGGRSR
jgi:hypothetical protein